jgi:hypothetical protein
MMSDRITNAHRSMTIMGISLLLAITSLAVQVIVLKRDVGVLEGKVEELEAGAK